MNHFPALTAPCPLIFLSDLSHSDEVALLANSDKTSLPKGTARSNNAYCASYPSYYLKSYQEFFVIELL